MMTKQYVFADVDGTLLNDKSVISFYRHYVDLHFADQAGAIWRGFLAEADALENQGASREQLNQWFYQTRFRDVPVVDVERTAASWWRTQRQRTDFWFDNVMARLDDHRRRGHELVLVTGSFDAIVAPLRERLGARHTLASPLVVRDARYTGALAGGAMIGAGKESAVRAFMRRHGIARADSYGYGDDESDVPFLALLGQPCVVSPAGSPMAALAVQRGWAWLAPVHGGDMPLARAPAFPWAQQVDRA
jgi:HAD superfamily hydrolase (TIGR01490 family)